MSVARVAVRPPDVTPPTQLHNATATLRARWPDNVSRDMDSAFDFAISAMTAPRQEYERHVRENRLSPTGIAEKMREYGAHIAPKLRLAESLVESGRQQLKQRKTQLMTPAMEDDPAAISIRREARDYLRSLSATERQVILAKNNPVFLAAVMEAPLELSGIDEATRDRMMEIHLRQNHEAELNRMARQEDAYDALHSAIEFAKGELRRYTGLAQYGREPDPDAPAERPAFKQTFDEWYAQVSAPHSPDKSRAVSEDVATLIRRAKDEISDTIDRAAGYR